MDPFFIIGVQRSGTTLLRLILNAHSSVAIPEEGTFWMPLLRELRGSYNETISENRLRRYMKYIKRNDQFKAWEVDGKFLEEVSSQKHINLAKLMESCYRNFAKSHGKSNWADKTPSFFRMIPELCTLFPNAKFIHVIRDGRDVYLSLKDREWQRKNVAVAAYEWSFKLEKVRQQSIGLGEDRYLEIRYESLVTQPEKQTRDICKFLHLEFEPNMLDFWKESQKYIGDHHSDLIFHPVSNKSTEKWKTEMSNEDILYFEYIASDWLKKLGYLLRHDEIQLKDRIFARVALCRGLPVRLLQVIYTAIGLKIAARLGKQTSLAGGWRRDA